MSRLSAARFRRDFFGLLIGCWLPPVCGISSPSLALRCSFVPVCVIDVHTYLGDAAVGGVGCGWGGVGGYIAR